MRAQEGRPSHCCLFFVSLIIELQFTINLSQLLHVVFGTFFPNQREVYRAGWALVFGLAIRNHLLVWMAVSAYPVGD